MFISPILTTPKKHDVSFTAGKTTLYTDFDGSYMPFKHDEICRENKAFSPEKFNSVFDDFNKFIILSKDKFELIVSTGRNLFKFTDFMAHVRNKQVKMPIPKVLITNNGGEIYSATNSDSFFTSTESLNYTDNNVMNLEKRKAIKGITGWDGKEIKTKVVNSLKSFGLDVFDSPINEFSDTYSNTILDQLQSKSYSHQSSSFASIQRNGEMGFHVALNKDLSNNPEKLNEIKESIAREIGDLVKFNIKVTAFDNECGNGPSIKISPKIDNHSLNKLYDTKLAVQNIMKNKKNDLVLIAGDGSNDLRMLNPFSYFGLVDEKLGEVGNKIVDCDNKIYRLSKKLSKNPSNHELQASLSETVNSKNELLAQINELFLKNPKLKEEIKELPFVSLSIKDEKGVLLIPKGTIDFFSNSPKIITTEKGKLFDGIKEAINQYSQMNNEFKTNMPKKMKKMLNIADSEKSTKFLVLGAIIGVIGFVAETVAKYNAELKAKKRSNSIESGALFSSNSVKENKFKSIMKKG